VSSLAVAAVATLAVAALVAAPQALFAQDNGLPPGVTEARVLEGEELFKGSATCWACHGEDAAGARGVGANLTDDEWWHSDGSYEAIVRTILSGVPGDKARNAFGAAMPPKGGTDLTDEQVRAVAAYVWSLRN
jgi:mono/diheme cytochrome c family protein